MQAGDRAWTDDLIAAAPAAGQTGDGGSRAGVSLVCRQAIRNPATDQPSAEEPIGEHVETHHLGILTVHAP